MAVLADRFTLDGTLGSGSMGTVYAATDLTTGAAVAVKTLHQLGPEGLLRLKHEFRALADLAHPNLVQLFELLGSDDAWFFTMEKVEGPTFLAWLQGRAGPEERVDSSTFDGWDGPVDPSIAGPPSALPVADRPVAPIDPDRVRDGFRQLCRGIAALHAADRLHRDLKPSNVRVAAEGRVVVLDFGLVVDARGAGGGAIAGSAAYMAPEQAAGLPIGPAADLYAVGVMLYEVLCGERPFAGTVAQLLQAKQRYDAPDPRRPGVPPDLASLCHALLARDPADRPSMTEVLRRLGDVGASSVNLPFGGRDAELELLRRAWREASAGVPVLVEVVGRSGIGKSALVRAFLDGLEDAVVLAGRCYERESVPYKALDTVVDALAEHLVRQGFEPTDPDAAVLAELFPVLRRVRGIARLPGRFVPDAQERRSVGFAALERLVRGIAPVVLYLDDAHWGDADSGVWMSHLLAAPAPVLVVWTRRSEHAPGPFVEVATGGATASHTRHLVALDVLPAEVTKALAAQLRPDAPPTSLDAMTRESGGNPLYLLEIAAAHAPGDTPPPSLDAAIRARAATLPPPARGLLEALAVAGRPWSVSEVAAAIGLDDPRAAVALLRAGRFARTDEAWIECLHDRVREAVTADLSAARAADLHGRLADRVLRDPDADPEQVAQHLEGAGDRTRAATWTERAAERASEKLAFDHAAALYRRALELDPPVGDRRRALSARLGHAHAAAGRASDATDAWLVAAVGAPLADRLELLRMAAEHLFASGHRDRGHVVLARALQEVGLWVPTHPIARGLDLAWQLLVAWVRGTEPPSPAGPPTERDLQQIDLCFSAMLGLVGTDRLASAQLQARHLNHAVRVGDPPRLARALAGEAVQAAFRGTETQRIRAQTLLDRARALASDDPALGGFVAYCAAVVAFFDDRMSDADTWFDRAESLHLAQPRAATWDLLRVRLMRVWPHLHAGRLRAMSDLVHALVQEAAERDNRYASVTAVGETGFVRWLVLDDPRGALEIVDAHAAVWQKRFDVQWYALSNARAQIALYRGDAHAAVAELTENERRLRWSMLWGIRMVRSGFRTMAARILCGAAQATGGSEREALLGAAVAHADAIARLGLPAGAGHAALIRGRVAVIRRQPEVAVTELDRARAVLEPRGYHLAGLVARRLAAIAQGDDAEKLRCDAALRAEGVVDPERFCVAVV